MENMVYDYFINIKILVDKTIIQLFFDFVQIIDKNFNILSSNFHIIKR